MAPEEAGTALDTAQKRKSSQRALTALLQGTKLHCCLHLNAVKALFFFFFFFKLQTFQTGLCRIFPSGSYLLPKLKLCSCAHSVGLPKETQTKTYLLFWLIHHKHKIN